MGFFYTCNMKKTFNINNMTTIFDNKGFFLEVKDNKIIIKKPSIFSYHHLKNIIYFWFNFFFIIRINLIIKLKNKIKNTNFFYYPILLLLLPLSLFLPKLIYYIFLKKNINIWVIYKDSFDYLYYDWRNLHNSLTKEGYNPENNSYVKISIKNNKYIITDGNHRVYLLKQMYPEGKEIDVFI